RVKDRELAEDLLQEVLLKVYNFCLSKSGVRNIRSWLFQIAHNTIIDMYREMEKVNTTSDFPILTEEDENLAFRDALPYILP
ncbi:sigma factor, partial [Klebsiella pneumoniae]|uniref:sigma factor n=1 Tax=Klebsiella pneumoniae TaxID=573 RepID=UPI0027308E0D